jgi:hypothetical protein
MSLLLAGLSCLVLRSRRQRIIAGSQQALPAMTVREAGGR